jgi:hypothetical protein
LHPGKQAGMSTTGRGDSVGIGSPPDPEPGAATSPAATEAAGVGFVWSLLAGLLAAKLAGLVLYMLSAALTFDPKGSGLVVAQVLYLVVRGVGGYVAVHLRRRSEVALTVGLALLDVGSMLGLLVGVGMLGLLPDALREEGVDLVGYAYELVAAVPGYGIGALLAFVQRRYLRRRTTETHTSGLFQRFVFALFGVVFQAAGAILCIIAFGVFLWANRSGGEPLNSPRLWISVFGASAAAGVGSLLLGLGKSLAAASAPPLKGSPDVVLLREFRQDDITFAANQNLPLKLLPIVDRRLEEVLVRVARRYGRVAAIGDPHELLPKTGAARVHFEADDKKLWKEQAAAYIDGSKVILVLLGSGEGLRWEYGRIASGKALARTILVVPPGGSAGWPVFRETVAAAGVTGLPDALPPNALLVRFDDDGRPRVYTASGSDADVYALRLKQALAELRAGNNAPGEVAEKRTWSLVTCAGVVLMSGLCAVYGGLAGCLGLMLITRGRPDALGSMGWTVAIMLGVAGGLVFGVRKGSKIKRFA